MKSKRWVARKQFHKHEPKDGPGPYIFGVLAKKVLHMKVGRRSSMQKDLNQVIREYIHGGTAIA